MRKLIAALAVLSVAGCAASPVITDSLRGPGPVLRTRNYTRPELEDLKNRGHTYLADYKTTRAAVLALCRANRLPIRTEADWGDEAGASHILTERSTLPARAIAETVQLLDKCFEELKLTRGRYHTEIAVTRRTHDKTNVLIREYFEAYDAKAGQWHMEFVPPGYVTKALFKQLDRRIRVLKNPKMLMWRNW